MYQGGAFPGVWTAAASEVAGESNYLFHEPTADVDVQDHGTTLLV